MIVQQISCTVVSLLCAEFECKAGFAQVHSMFRLILSRTAATRPRPVVELLWHSTADTAGLCRFIAP